VTTREAWDRVTAKRQEHQTAAGLQAAAQATQDDHKRAGMERIESGVRHWLTSRAKRADCVLFA
jgi:hypothetical protein